MSLSASNIPQVSSLLLVVWLGSLRSSHNSSQPVAAVGHSTKMSADNGKILKIAGAMILPNLGGIINGQITRSNLQSWYKKLNFPSYRPPNWIFAPMWTTLYSSMGYASYLVWRDGGGFAGDARTPLVVFGVQLALNWAWTPIFFGQRNIKAGLVDLLALTATATACGVLFHNVNKIAGYLFVPYVAWLSFATMLNYSIFKLNPEDKAIEGATAPTSTHTAASSTAQSADAAKQD